MIKILSSLLPGRAPEQNAAPKPKRINLALQAAARTAPSPGACWNSF